MKKVKLSSANEVTDVSTIKEMIGLGLQGGLIKTKITIADLKLNIIVNDCNKLHELVPYGITLRTVSTATQNAPETIGILVHIQRSPKGDVGGTQIIGQLFISANGFKIRSGQGAGTSVVFTGWKAL